MPETPRTIDLPDAAVIYTDQLAIGSGRVRGKQCLLFRFRLPDGAYTPVMALSNINGLGDALTNALLDLSRQGQTTSPSEEDIPIFCGDCGARIFGDLAEAGRCLTCKTRTGG